MQNLETQNNTTLVLEEGTTYTYTQLIDLIESNSEVILTVARIQLQQLKNGLSVKRSRRNRKLKEQGHPIEDTVFDYSIISETADSVRIRIKNKPRSAILVHSVQTPGDF